MNVEMNNTDRLIGIAGDPDVMQEWQVAMQLDSKEGWKAYARWLEDTIMVAVNDENLQPKMFGEVA